MESGIKTYYEKEGLGHDHLLRCADCKKLVLFADLQTHGSCKYCGNRRVTEVTTLSVLEWLRVRTGLLSFPHRKEFIKEFSRGV